MSKKKPSPEPLLSPGATKGTVGERGKCSRIHGKREWCPSCIPRPVLSVSRAEYDALRMVAEVAKNICARFPFDPPEEMRPRYKMLALYLATLARARGE